jgi:glycosyltransferase 2 family protein
MDGILQKKKKEPQGNKKYFQQMPGYLAGFTRGSSVGKCHGGEVSVKGVFVNQPNQKAFVIVSLFILGIMILGLVVALYGDIPKLMEILNHIQMEPLIFALICTFIAYLAFTLSFNGLFEMTPFRVPFDKFFSIMFISATINFIISSGGWAGIAIRSFLLKQHKVPYSVTIPLSFAQNMIFNLVLSCVCFTGLFYLRQHPEMIGGSKEFVVLLFMVGLLLLVGFMLLIFFNTGFRRWVLRLVIRTGNWLSHKILKKRSDNQRLAEMRNNLDSTIKFFHKGWFQLLLVLFWVSMDWGFTALTLYFCFHSVGVDLPLGLLMVGFTIFFLTSNINPVPAGLGVSEVALAGAFSLLGIGFEKTMVAALLFRFVFFLLPLAVSTALYLDTMRNFLKHRVEENETGFKP